jgi:hypothetical protein
MTSLSSQREEKILISSLSKRQPCLCLLCTTNHTSLWPALCHETENRNKANEELNSVNITVCSTHILGVYLCVKEVEGMAIFLLLVLKKLCEGQFLDIALCSDS